MNRSDRVPAAQLYRGLPQTVHSALTPLGEIEQATKIAEGWRQPRQGWRRAVFVVGTVVLAVSAALMVIAGIYGAAQQ
ncbi:hypothetical protein ACQP2Y_12055 [Actinoplanes sp. CA-051413]|uniref:hypothetical protein n=1 Tax=Actinoplanes sp. CA-051413 TaxID=3239899 RepID=UPI003D962C96